MNKLYNAFIVCLLVSLADQTFAQQFGANNVAQRELSNIALRTNDEYLINHFRALELSRTTRCGRFKFISHYTNRREKNATAGNFSTAINVADKAPGTYILKIIIGDKIYSRKVLIIR